MEPVQTSVKFVEWVLHPWNQPSMAEKALAWAVTIILGIASLGTVHLGCALYKHFHPMIPTPKTVKITEASTKIIFPKKDELSPKEPVRTPQPPQFLPLPPDEPLSPPEADALAQIRTHHLSSPLDSALFASRNFMLRLLEFDPRATSAAAESLWDDPAFVLGAEALGITAIYRASDRLKRNVDFMIKAMSVGPFSDVFEIAETVGLYNNPTFMLAALSLNPRIDKFIPQPLLQSKDFLLALMKENHVLALTFLYRSAPHYLDDREFMTSLLAISPQLTFDALPKQSPLLSDPTFMQKVFEQVPLAAALFASPQLLENVQFMTAILNKNPSLALFLVNADSQRQKRYQQHYPQFMSSLRDTMARFEREQRGPKERQLGNPPLERLAKDPKFMAELLQENSIRALQIAFEHRELFQNINFLIALARIDINIALIFAYRENKAAFRDIRFISEAVRINPTLVLRGLEPSSTNSDFMKELLPYACHEVVQYTSLQMTLPPGFLCEAVRANLPETWVLERLPCSLRQNGTFMLELLRITPMAFMFASRALQHDLEWIEAAIRINPSVSSYLPTRMPSSAV
jgi:hypothetical protein